MQLTAADIAALADGFTGITIGRSDGTGAITVDAITFGDPVTIRSPQSGGTIAVNGQITGSDDATVRMWDIGTGGIKRAFYRDPTGRSGASPIRSVAVSSQRVIGGNDDGTVCVWDGDLRREQ